MTLEAPDEKRLKFIKYLQDCLELVSTDEDRETLEQMLLEELNKGKG